jgi:hypothetical protein
MRRSLSASLLIVLLTLCLSAGAAGDDKKKARPDFSGTWKLDGSKSEYGLFSDRPLSKADATLVVTHREPELKLVRTLRLNGHEETREFTYFTDERGESNPGSFGSGVLNSKTRWDGERVTAHAKTAWPARGGRPEVLLETTQTWQLSSGGKALTHTTRIVNGEATEEVKLVYRRAG